MFLSTNQRAKQGNFDGRDAVQVNVHGAVPFLTLDQLVKTVQAKTGICGRVRELNGQAVGLGKLRLATLFQKCGFYPFKCH